MSASQPSSEGAVAHRNSPGRPPKFEIAERVLAAQRALSHLHDWRSSVTGKALSNRALAYILWRLNERDHRVGDYLAPWPPPPPPPGPDRRRLEKARTDAIAVVRQALAKRAGNHLCRARAGEEVLALRMSPRGGDQGGHFVGLGEVLLPGLYSPAWPTTIGLPGEATLEEAEEAVRRGGLVIVALEPAEIRDVQVRFRTAVPDEPTIAEEVARRYSRQESRDRGESQAAERYVERLFANARRWEFVHLGSEGFTGRQKLPPPRAYHCLVCGSALTLRRHGVYCSPACERWGEKP